ncbi:MAG: hypothetical protein NT169_25310 [Chloroflexi bacterium]|nr:hypothetical protein [Chloroflexota bacterium]
MLSSAARASLRAAMRAALVDPEVEREAERLDAEQQRLKRQAASLLDAVEDGGGALVRERLRERELELNWVIALRAELERKRVLARVEVSDAKLAEVLQVMRANVQADDVVVARRGLAAFVEKIEVHPEKLVISYHQPIGSEDVLVFGGMPQGDPDLSPAPAGEATGAHLGRSGDSGVHIPVKGTGAVSLVLCLWFGRVMNLRTHLLTIGTHATSSLDSMQTSMRSALTIW